MKQPDGAVLAILVTSWLQKADLDLRAGDALLASEPPLLFPACYHFQQAAEKFLSTFHEH
ncbi:MAG: hypothetical protein A2284_18270 [Deltaproteobacteria bacterium RIFOXYA12_FULL_61_11]|nr:MAG: hypothetical protein A2284_18270 [Deltaproteobacteria bacterium RIFOXYA12_FULL_61_11]